MLNNNNVDAFINDQIASIKKQVKDKKVICAISGGVDSSVSAVLVHKAIGDQLHCVFVDHGLLRQNEVSEVLDSLQNKLGLKIQFVDAKELFLDSLKGVTDPEQKRKIIGKVFIDVFEKVAKDLGDDFSFLVQGTIYPDILESENNGKVVKSHHNVGGLPDNLKVELVEPVRDLYKADVRLVAKHLNMPEHFITRQPFPGPGLGVRVVGEINEAKLSILRDADFIFRDEITKSGFNKDAFQFFAIITDIKTTGVRDENRIYGHTIALRAIHSKDAVTAQILEIPFALLKKVAKRITDEIPTVNRVLYDITDKPVATIEWE